MSRAKTNSPSMIRIVISLWFHPGMTTEEIAAVAYVGADTTASYMRHLLDDELIHISGWRPSKVVHGFHVREYSAGPQIGQIPAKPAYNDDPAYVQPPRFVRLDPIYAALMGV